MNYFKKLMSCTNSRNAQRIHSGEKPPKAFAGLELYSAEDAEKLIAGFTGDGICENYAIYPCLDTIWFAIWPEENPQDGIEFLVRVDDSFPPIVISWLPAYFYPCMHEYKDEYRVYDPKYQPPQIS
ncbi:MAG TPA: hypothetical protein PKL77_06195 [Candidatus Omnitrophota bacterium]|nr:hypothetical protein [Candidatus Omnitrophota bacterium]